MNLLRRLTFQHISLLWIQFLDFLNQILERNTCSPMYKHSRVDSEMTHKSMSVTVKGAAVTVPTDISHL